MSITNSRLGNQVQTYQADLLNIYNADIQDHVRVGTFTEIGGATIGEGTVISAFCFVCPGVTIGKNCFIGTRTTFLNDTSPGIKENFVPESTVVEDNVIIGAGCIITAGVKIGKGAKIMDGAIVTGDVAAGTTVLGFTAGASADVERHSPAVPEHIDKHTIFVKAEDMKPEPQQSEIDWGSVKVYNTGTADEENPLVGGKRRSAPMPDGWEETLDKMEALTDRLAAKIPIDYVGHKLDPVFCEDATLEEDSGNFELTHDKLKMLLKSDEEVLNFFKKETKIFSREKK